MNNNIEEKIKRLEKLINDCKNNKECKETKICSDCYMELEDVKAIENILADREKYKQLFEEASRDVVKLSKKANAYDSLVEKIKGNLRDRELIKECATVSDREHLNGEIFALQELLDTVEEER